MAARIELLIAPIGGASSADDIRILGPAERDRARRFRFELHRNRYVRRHSWLRREIARRTGLAPGAIHFDAAAAGKPRIDNAGVVGLQVNWSSSQALALLGLDKRHAIGVDIEVIRAFRGMDEFAAAHYGRSEQAGIRAAGRDPQSMQTAFYRVWTRKEAFLKCTGLGLVDDLEALQVGWRNTARPQRYRDATGREHVCYLWTWVLREPAAAISVASTAPLPNSLQPEIMTV